MSMSEEHYCRLTCDYCTVRQFPAYTDHEDAEYAGREAGWEKDGHSHRCPECSRAMDALALGQLQKPRSVACGWPCAAGRGTRA